MHTAIQQAQPPAVNFYILPDSDRQNRHFFVFRLVEKAFEQQLPTVILTADDEQSQALDRLLWTAKPARFIPHEIISAPSSGDTLPSILLTSRLSDIQALQVLGFAPQVVIDLSPDGTPLDFPKIMLVANQHQEVIGNARMKYQIYVNQGIQPTVHKISEKQLALSD